MDNNVWASIDSKPFAKFDEDLLSSSVKSKYRNSY